MALMGHYYSMHRSQCNFFVTCGVNGCPATFRKYHSFYKHIVPKHRGEYHVVEAACNVNREAANSDREPDVTRDSSGMNDDDSLIGDENISDTSDREVKAYVYYIDNRLLQYFLYLLLAGRGHTIK